MAKQWYQDRVLIRKQLFPINTIVYHAICTIFELQLFSIATTAIQQYKGLEFNTKLICAEEKAQNIAFLYFQKFGDILRELYDYLKSS
jgi:hypothetical protein